MSAKDMMKHLEGIAQRAETDANALLAQDRYKEAKVVITNAERDVRDLKRAATETQRNVRQQGSDARASTNKSGQMLGLVAGSKARGNMSRGRAMQKRKIADKVTDAVRPYDAVKSTCDNVLSQMARSKAHITQEEQAAKASTSTTTASQSPTPTTVTAPPPPPTPATWAGDPYGRHELRYWDGTQWTQHVSNRGVTGTDSPG